MIVEESKLDSRIKNKQWYHSKEPKSKWRNSRSRDVFINHGNLLIEHSSLTEDDILRLLGNLYFAADYENETIGE